MVLAINIFTTMLSAIYWSMSTIAVSQILLHVLLHIFRLHWDRFGILLYGVVAPCFIAVHSLQGILSILLVVASSWLVIGRRQPGEYDWDQSNYCQMWNLHLTLSQIMKDGSGNTGVLTSLAGTAYIVWYLRALGAKIGKNCAIWAGGQVGVMSEPDLVEVRLLLAIKAILLMCLIANPTFFEIGDNVSLDDCAAVAHINSRGRFSLNRLKIGDSLVIFLCDFAPSF
jgi:hypothetical protein